MAAGKAGGHFSEVNLVYILGFGVYVRRISLMKRNREWPAKFPTTFIHLSPFFHKMDANLRTRACPLWFFHLFCHGVSIYSFYFSRLFLLQQQNELTNFTSKKKIIFQKWNDIKFCI